MFEYYYLQSSGGPPLIFDHQMAMDSAAQVLYVCGGRVNDNRAGESRYCGLYSYDVATNKWRLLQYEDIVYHWPSQLTRCLTLDRRRTWAHLSLQCRGV